MFDAHNHLDDPRFDDTVDDVVARARDAGLVGCVVAGYGPERFRRQSRIAERFPALTHVTYGVHPWCVLDLEDDAALDDALDALESALDEPDTLALVEAVGVGELGLDAVRGGGRDDTASWQRQQRAFEAQLELAARCELPLVLHVVRAHNEVLSTLRDASLPAGGMVHGFAGSAEIVEAYVELGLHVSIGASLVGLPDDTRLHRAVAAIPDARLLVETDAPDGTPRPRRPAPNEPAWLDDVIDSVAAAREAAPDEIARLTTENAQRLFGLGSP